jgi:GT2 family glycosyltransferase
VAYNHSSFHQVRAGSAPEWVNLTTALPKVCISVLNWNSAGRTIRCLDALMLLDYPNYRIIVVDNASTDDSVHRIRDAYPDMEIIGA